MRLYLLSLFILTYFIVLNGILWLYFYLKTGKDVLNPIAYHSMIISFLLSNFYFWKYINRRHLMKREVYFSIFAASIVSIFLSLLVDNSPKVLLVIAPFIVPAILMKDFEILFFLPLALFDYYGIKPLIILLIFFSSKEIFPIVAMWTKYLYAYTLAVEFSLLFSKWSFLLLLVPSLMLLKKPRYLQDLLRLSFITLFSFLVPSSLTEAVDFHLLTMSTISILSVMFILNCSRRGILRQNPIFLARISFVGVFLSVLHFFSILSPILFDISFVLMWIFAMIYLSLIFYLFIRQF